MKKTLLQCLMVVVILLTGVVCIVIALLVKLLKYFARTDMQAGTLPFSSGRAHQPQPAYNFTRVVFDKETKQLKRIIKI